ncbi:MAG: hypothetical protein KGH60_00245 [Candidatus Micrarchaeota archaeon]|nr:hypothetical protein [Candidatus Micrarchaeota archaeon]
MRESRCIICGNARNGLEVQEDQTIRIIRWFKKNVTKNEKGYRLVVCKECFPKYKKKRDSFVRKRITYLVIGVIFTIALVALAGPKAAFAVLYGIGIIVFMYLLSQLSYMPALHMPEAKPKK